MTEDHQTAARQIGARLRKERVAQSLSLEKVAGLADITTTGLWMIEVGRRMPGTFTFLKITHALGLEGKAFKDFLTLEWEPMPQGFRGFRLAVVVDQEAAAHDGDEAMRTSHTLGPDQHKHRAA